MVNGFGKLVSELAKRGTEVVPFSGASRLAALETKYSLTFGSDIVSIYSQMDGFKEYDEKSQFNLWGVNQIALGIKNYGIKRDNNGVIWMPIGDYFIESDIIEVAAESNLAEVRLSFEGKVLGNSIDAFFKRLILGQFDLDYGR